MKKIVIPARKINENDINDRWLQTQHRSFLFQLNYEFYLIMYPAYMERYSHLDMKEDFLKQILEMKKPIKKENVQIGVQRSYQIKDIKKDILSGVVFNTEVKEALYTYEDNARKEYCFVAKHSYLDWIEMQFGYSDRRSKAEEIIDEDKMLDDDEKRYLKGVIKDLFLTNTSQLAYVSEYEQVTLAQLILTHSIKNKRKGERA